MLFLKPPEYKTVVPLQVILKIQLHFFCYAGKTS